MKLSDYVTDFLVENGIKYTFGITGGAIVHILDSIQNSNDIENICNQHEQAGAMAADAYSRVTDNFGVAITTSGPGATNLVTGTCCSYFDSIPVLLLTGQVPRSQIKTGFSVRQIGFQETDVVSMFKDITKYSKLVEEPEMIKYELEKALYLAKSGRPGPVLLDIPDDIQRADINPTKILSYIPNREDIDNRKLEENIDYTVKQLENAKRPVIILGGGIRLSKTQDQVRNLVERLNVPIALTWGARDLYSFDYPNVIENFGVTAGRAGNFAVQNSDLILALGTRLDTHETGNNLSSFAREATKIIIDIDDGELDKYEKRGMKNGYYVKAELSQFLEGLNKKNIKTQNVSEWNKRVEEWKDQYPICLPEYREQKEKVNPYYFLELLSEESKNGDIIITDAGGNLSWTMQGYRVKEGQRLFSAFNHSPMGYSLPASIGACLANDKNPVICIIGDGGIQMNIQELATIKKNNLPIKIFLFNNNGYGIIQQTQDTWLDSRYAASNPDSGVAVPDFRRISQAYDINTSKIEDHSQSRQGIRKVLDHSGPILCDIQMEQHQKIVPKLEFGKSIEDSSPLLNREEFIRNMIVKPLD